MPPTNRQQTDGQRIHTIPQEARCDFLAFSILGNGDFNIDNTYEVLKDMPPQAGRQLQTLFAELIRSGEEEGPKCILSDEYQDAYRDASNDEPSP
ncbi:hypothetical protein BOTCAL_0388g00010 [Botryotinia calthae]|uniref:Uncharacterized protein n=1 Tax=Botryotinia calthae TaxID=38488 RepID=A0A4Y8CR27_9HELO|nr:hypothetical protein BOTCAL_0388g00010 [Botryotinia calthae]